MLGGLIALLIIYGALGINPRFLGIDLDPDPPLDRCVTEQAVLKFLDGKTILSTGPIHSVGRGIGTITLRKEKISSLIIRSVDFGSIIVRFNLDHESTQYLVEATFKLTTSDDPQLHYHGWVQFIGQVVTSR